MGGYFYLSVCYGQSNYDLEKQQKALKAEENGWRRNRDIKRKIMFFSSCYYETQ